MAGIGLQRVPEILHHRCVHAEHDDISPLCVGTGYKGSQFCANLLLDPGVSSKDRRLLFSPDGLDMLVVPTKQVTFTQHILRSVYRHEIEPQHVNLPTLMLVFGHEVHCPKVNDTVTIRLPLERLVPEVLLALDKCPSTSGKFTNTAVLRPLSHRIL